MKKESKAAKKLVVRKDVLASLAVKSGVKTGKINQSAYSCNCQYTDVCSGWTC